MGHGVVPACGAAPPGDYEAVAVGERHTCAVRTDGAVRCWGYQPTPHDVTTR